MIFFDTFSELRKKISEFHSALRTKLQRDLTTAINSKLR
jgi:hypothetical protein